jgi:hypothetical protein
VVVSSPQASPITKQKGIEIVADQLAITDVQPQPVTAPGLITVTGTLLLAPGTPSDTAAAGTASVGGGLAAALTVSGGPWPVTIEGPYSQTELTLRLGALPAALTPGTTGEATLTLTRGALQCPPKQIRYEIPGITSVTPANARIGDVITIVGVQLISTTPGAALPTVTVGGISATAVTVSAGSPNTLTATVADTTPLAAATDVVVSPPGASPITSHNAIAIVADQPTITGVQPEPVTGPGLITVAGTLLLAPGTPSGTAAAGTSSVGGLTAALTVTGDSWPITIEGPYSDDTLTLHVGTPPAALSSGAPGDATLTLTRGALNATEQVRYALT